MTITTWMLLLPLLAFALGVVLLIRGLRGRRVDDHPICRRCGFDLFNRPETSTQCAECGADLTGPHAIRQGRRVRRGGMIFAGATLVGIVLAIGVWAGWTVLSSANWRTYAPVWYLRREARGVEPRARDAALAELSKRLAAGALKQTQIDAVTDDALAQQGNLSKPWVNAWGDFVEAADAAGKVSKPRLDKYLGQALTSGATLDLRPQITRGDPIPLTVRWVKARLGTKPTLYLYAKLSSVEVGGMHKTDPWSGGGSPFLNDGSTGIVVDLKLGDSENLKEGRNELVVHLDVEISRNRTGISTSAPSPSPLYASKLDLKSTFVVHPAGESTVKINRDPSLRPKIEKEIACRNVDGQPRSRNFPVATIDVGAIPTGVGFDVYVMVNGKEHKIGEFGSPGRRGSFVFRGYVPPFTDSRVDLVLKPSVDAAIHTTDTFEIWDGQIVLKNVPVWRPNPATWPTELIIP